ncbi:DUF397 domain-containing protein [Streptomyces sp. NBS 14/10]|uniref:DUF397 domain-containing protein n=1 Tax=Streptomyces sp. NBS 14/10 TaxID=1945643 RepID=UPI000B7CD16E|nr:DUF397 domain-containing protein [Streptomyces sp. NBS 14/10]KAK1180527.1 DUF397 domain-containing protein [Streptomyces sp. NBS 14/10]NUP37706.1 DUF397 domain-containing protein [Streptomyces sp.]
MHDIPWRKSSFSGNGVNNECLELAAADGAIHLRESEAPGTAIRTARRPLAAFIRAAKAGAFDHLR